MATLQCPSVEEIIHNPSAFEKFKAELDVNILEAHRRLNGEIFDGRFDNETKEERTLRSHDLSQWYCVDLPWNQAQENSCEAMLRCENWSRKAWFLKGCNMKISVCDRCWNYHDSWRQNVDYSISLSYEKE